MTFLLSCWIIFDYHGNDHVLDVGNTIFVNLKMIPFEQYQEMSVPLQVLRMVRNKGFLRLGSWTIGYNLLMRMITMACNNTATSRNKVKKKKQYQHYYIMKENGNVLNLK